jgi:hypothetical protein
MLMITRMVLMSITAVVTSIGPAITKPATFAQFALEDGAAQQRLVFNAGNESLVSATVGVGTSFSETPELPFFCSEVATFTLTIYSNELCNCSAPCGPGNLFVEPNFTGKAEYIARQDADANLLYDTFAVTDSLPPACAQFCSRVGRTGCSDASTTADYPDRLILMLRCIPSEIKSDVNAAAVILSWPIQDFNHATAAADDADPSSDPFEAAGSGILSSILPQPEPGLMILELQGGGLIAIGIMRRRKA